MEHVVVWWVLVCRRKIEMARAAKAAAALPASGGNLLASLLTLSGSFRCLGLDNVETQAFDPSPVAKLMSGVSGPGEKKSLKGKWPRKLPNPRGASSTPVP